ncbi:hypothetical protein GQ457_13G019870 [Hibiscus cannabinus]
MAEPSFHFVKKKSICCLELPLPIRSPEPFPLKHQLGIYIHCFIGFREMNWVQRKIYLYNVTFGLYMLDWWERYLFNTLMIVLMWFVFYNSSRYVTEFCKRHLSYGW